MRATLRSAILALALMATTARIAGAEPQGSYLTLTPTGGYTLFDGNMRFNAPANGSLSLQDVYYAGGRIGYQARPWVGLEVAAGYSPSSLDVPNGPDVRFIHASANLMFTPFAGPFGGPFILVGGGMSQLKPDDTDALKQGNFELGAGLRFWLNDHFGMRVEARDLNWMDGDEITHIRTHTVIFGAGLTAVLGGKPRDTDLDGVPDRADRCPNTPTGARVDANGCPLDSDQDGVFDGLDQCEGTPKGATVDAKGCPHDADGDGVWDGLDQCADTPKGATVDAKGCPMDSDADGVWDGLDRCEGTLKGCTVDSTGCPRDADGDGVCDGLDQCDGTSPGLKVDAKGCPIEVIERETELLDTGMIRLQDVHFETAKAALLPDALPSINVVGQVLSKWPQLRIEIGGHTDARGSNAYNQKLSEARVQSVLDYLLQQFPTLKREQFTTKGYGESKPLVPNTTELNWAKNRRVEFKVLNTEVLKKEVERRKLLENKPETTPETKPEVTPEAKPDSTQAPGGK